MNADVALAKLKGIYFDEWEVIIQSFGYFIISENLDALTGLLEKYFSNDQAKELLCAPIAFISDKADSNEGKLFSPAGLAASFSKRKALTLLLGITGQPNQQDASCDSLTLLMIAARNGDLETIKILLKAGADINLTAMFNESFDQTALTSALSNHFEKITHFLLSQGAKAIIVDAFLAIKEDRLDLLTNFVQSNPDLVHQGRKDNNATMLHCAAYLGNMPMVEYLISQGADLNACDKSGLTPLGYALSEKQVNVANYLQSIGGLSRNGASVSNATQDEALKQEITGSVERLELLEEKFGISIDGLYATCENIHWMNPQYYSVKLNFDVTGTGADIERDFSICLNAYNTNGQLLGTAKEYISKDDFMGFESKNILLHVDQSPARLRLYPAA